MVESTTNQTIEDNDPNQGSISISFDPNDVAGWSKHLEEEGFAVLKGVLPQEDVEKARSMMFNWFEGLGSGIKMDDVSTWKTKNWPGHAIGFLTANGGGQTEASWFIRSHPNVMKAFKDIWKTEEDPDPALLTSMDTFICWRPWENPKRDDENWNPYVENLHCD